MAANINGTIYGRKLLSTLLDWGLPVASSAGYGRSDLRHTYATLLLAKGTHPTYVQKSLGHASVQLTLDRYSHWMPSMGRNTAKWMDEVLG